MSKHSFASVRRLDDSLSMLQSPAATGKRDAYIQQLSTELVTVQQTLRQCQNMLRLHQDAMHAPSPPASNTVSANSTPPVDAVHTPTAVPSHTKPMAPSSVEMSTKSSASLVRMANGAMIDALLLRQTLAAGDSASQLATMCHPPVSPKAAQDVAILRTPMAHHDARYVRMDCDQQPPWTL